MRRRPILIIGVLFLTLFTLLAIFRNHRQENGKWRDALQEKNETTAPITAEASVMPLNGVSQDILTPGNYSYTFRTVDGERSYTLHVPRGYDGSKNLPLLVHLHGGMGTAESSDASTGFSALSDERGFLLVYGQGSKGRIGLTSWNAGDCCGSSQEKNNNVDDVGYIETVLTHVQEKVKVDPGRVYVSGMSNGSMLANRLACEIPKLLAGVATVSGTTQVDTCNPSKPLPHIIIHGTADTNVPYNGGRSKSPFNSGTFLAVEDELQTWSKRNGCEGNREITRLSDAAKDGTSVDTLKYQRCPQGKEVVLYRVNGGEHAWPGGRAGTNALERAESTKDLNASETILNFFGI